MENIVKNLSEGCPFIDKAFEKNNILIKNYKITSEKDALNIINFNSLLFLKRIRVLKHSNSFCIVTFLLINKTNSFKEKNLSVLLDQLKEKYLREPIVYGYLTNNIGNKEKIFCIVIRPYIGDVDNKFFINKPHFGRNKLTLREYLNYE